mgnify:CR=1 FL=1
MLNSRVSGLLRYFDELTRTLGGVAFFEGFDYLYDAAGGYVGYRWNGKVSSAYGGTTPVLSLHTNRAPLPSATVFVEAFGS